MKIQISGENIEITPRVRELVEKKLTPSLDKYLRDFDEDLKTAGIMIEKHSRLGYKVKFNMRLPSKQHILAEAVDDKLKNAIIEVREQLERQIRKYKDKITHPRK